jgi:hypothetical protein
MYLVASVMFFVVSALVRAGTGPDEAGAAAPGTAVQSPAPLRPGSRPDADAPPGVSAPEQVTLGITIDDDDLECTLGAANVDAAVRERLEAACRRVDESGTEQFKREFADNFPLTMLVFIPLVAGIMKLLYVFERRKYVEHLVFFLHVHTLFFVVALGTALLVGLTALEIPAWMLGVAAWLYFLAYLYLAMRAVYRQSHARTSMKYVVLGISYFAAAVLTLLGAVIVTAVTA